MFIFNLDMDAPNKVQKVYAILIAFIISFLLSTPVLSDPITPNFVKNYNKGPSFDCSSNLSSIEQIICAEDEPLLRGLDNLLLIVYNNLRTRLKEEIPPKNGNLIIDTKGFKSEKQLVLDQMGWLKSRNEAANSSLLEGYYKARIKLLSDSYSVFLGSYGGLDQLFYSDQGAKNASDCKITGLLEEHFPESGYCVENVPFIRHFEIIIADGYFAAGFGSLGASYSGCWGGYFGKVDELANYYSITLTQDGLEFKPKGNNEDPCGLSNGPSISGTYGAIQ